MKLPLILLFVVVTVNSESVFKDCQFTKILPWGMSSIYPIKDELKLEIFNENNNDQEFDIKVCLLDSSGGEKCINPRIIRGTVVFTPTTDGMRVSHVNGYALIKTGAADVVGVRISAYFVSIFIAENCCKDCPFHLLKQEKDSREYRLPEKGSVDLLTHTIGNTKSVAGIFLEGKCLLVLLHNGASSRANCSQFSVGGTAILSLKRARGGVRIRLSGEESFIPFKTRSWDRLQVRSFSQTEIIFSYKYYGEWDISSVAAGSTSPDYLVQDRIHFRISSENNVPFSAKIYVQDRCFVHFFKNFKYDNNCYHHLEGQETFLRFQVTNQGLKLEKLLESESKFQNVVTLGGVQRNSSLNVESETSDISTAYCDCKDCPDFYALDLIQENPLYPFPEKGFTELIIHNVNKEKVTTAVYLGDRCLVRLHFNGAKEWDTECYFMSSKSENVTLHFAQEDGRIKMRYPDSEEYIDLIVQPSPDVLLGLTVKTWGSRVRSSYKHHPLIKVPTPPPTPPKPTHSTLEQSTTLPTPSTVTGVPRPPPTLPKPTHKTLKQSTTPTTPSTGPLTIHSNPEHTVEFILWVGIGVLLIHLVAVTVVVIWDMCRQKRRAPEARPDGPIDALEMRPITRRTS